MSDSTPSRSITASLLQKAQNRDEAAWWRLVTIFQPFVYSTLRSRNVTVGDIPDLVQNVFLRVQRGIGSFRRDQPGATFRGWLYRISCNEANDYFQKGRLQHLDDSFAAKIPEPEEDSESLGERAALAYRVLDSIREDFQANTFQVFWRCEIEGHDTQQVASDLGMKKSAVREARRRVWKRLREECRDLLGYDISLHADPEPRVS